MAVWRVALSFPVFFTAAYRDNSVLLQGDAVNVLLVGDGTPDQMLGKDIVTRYISGKRPISRTTVSTLIKLDEETLMDRVSKSGIQDVILGAQCLSNLMQSEHIEIPAYAKNAIQEISYEDDPYRFIARCFLQAVRCPKDSLVPISKEMMEDILTCRAELSPSEQAAERTPEKLVTPKASDQSMQDADEADLLINTKTLPAVKGMATYRISGLNYEKEREKIKLLLLDGQDGNMKRQLTTKELYDSLEIMRVSAKTWLIEFQGTPAGLTDILVHRLKEKQCTQISLICTARSQYSIRKLRSCLGNIAHYYLTDDGLMAFAYGFEEGLKADEFHIQVIYSVSEYTKEDEMLDKITMDEHFLPLNPWEKYSGRVPDFLSPLQEVRDASGDFVK